MSYYTGIYVDTEIMLKPIEEANAHAIFELVEQSRQHLSRWLPWVEYNTHLNHTRQFIRGVLAKKNWGEQAVYVIWYANTIAGIIDLHGIDANNRKANIGYWLGHRFTGLGIMTRACKGLIDTAFGFYDFNRVVIKCATENRQSCAIPEKLHFTLEGIERQSEWLNGCFVDLKVYSILHAEWKERYG